MVAKLRSLAFPWRESMRIGSLFSGIGGLELGLERAGLGHTAWQVERDPFCLSVLQHHWPEALRLDDVHHAGRATLPRVDLICGGFPCQDVSSAGNRAGLAGSRSGLWREFARVVSEMRPAWVVVENVASGANLWLDAVVRDLEELAYACLPLPLSAAGVGAPHLRRRIFVVAYADGIGSGSRGARGASPCGEGGRPEDQENAATRHADAQGEPAIAVDGQVAELRGDADAADASSGGLATRRDDPRACRRQRPCWAGSPDSGWGPPEPVLRGVDDGIPRRMDRLRALGNAVVPQCAEVVGWVIRELKGECNGNDGIA